MKQLFSTSLVFAVLTLSFSAFLGAQNIEVATFQDGLLILKMDDATLSTTFAFVLNDATLSNTQIKSATDAEGTFYYISANGQRGSEANIKVAIILNQLSTGVLVFDKETGCEMECSVEPSCTAYDQNIIARCKTISCTCTDGTNRGCKSRVIFPK